MYNLRNDMHMCELEDFIWCYCVQIPLERYEIPDRGGMSLPPHTAYLSDIFGIATIKRSISFTESCKELNQAISWILDKTMQDFIAHAKGEKNESQYAYHS